MKAAGPGSAAEWFAEASIFLLLVGAIFFSNLASRAHRRRAALDLASIFDDWVSLVQSFFGAFGVYATVRATTRMEWWKRAAIAVSAGVSSDTVSGWTR